MKRGKEEEKVVGPMFPRLHVNDTEKGGPRAPPRNKMALYEQFSVPSNRFNQTRPLPLKPNAPPQSSSQGTGRERSHVFAVHSPSQATTRRESCSSQQYNGENMNTSLAEDDFTVPIYINSRNGQSNDRPLESFSGRNLTPMGSMNCGCSEAVENDSEKDPKQFGSPLVDIRKDARRESEGCPQVRSGRDQPVMYVENKSLGEPMDSMARQAKSIPNQEFQDCSMSSIRRSCQADACSEQECVAGSQSNADEHGDGLLESMKDANNGNTLLPGGLISRANQTGTQNVNNDVECLDTRTSDPMQQGNSDESDDASKISTVEKFSSQEVSPDDVVGILGQKHFWKARREIVNQQRIFAVQVFELHRLIKVQQLIAGSPDLMLEDAAFIGKIPVKGSTAKNLSLEVIVEPKQQNLKRKNDSQKPNHKMEGSAENAVARTSLPSLRSGSTLSNYTPFPGNPHQDGVAADNRIGPLCFNPSPGHQWLVPVMSPSEGLVYKPYPAPGFTGSMCGGFGPFGPVPLSNTFMSPVYGVPASHEGIGAPPYIPPGSHAYFHPYGMPVMNLAMSGSAVEQANQFTAEGSLVQNSHSSPNEASVSTHNQSSSNTPVQRNASVPHVRKPQASKESELQGSSASSRSGTTQGTTGARQIAGGGRDEHSPFPMAPVVSDGTHHSLETRQQTQVIKVVPHNARSATESAARIFRSIQEERKQYDA